MRGHLQIVRLTSLVGLASLSAMATADSRWIDGSHNNPNHTDMGRTATRLVRMTNGYVDGTSVMPDGPNPRAISTAVFDQEHATVNARGLTDYVWAWGQFLDHDIDLSPSGGASVPIVVLGGDPDFPTGAQIPFTRAASDPTSGTEPSNPLAHMNQITTWIDASNVYGSDLERAAFLRTFDGGRLRTQAFPEGDLPPFNDGTMANEGGHGTHLFVVGDVRGNEHNVLTSLHTVFLREHNRLADELSLANPDWNDETIYQQARKLVGGIMQAVTYNEFLPALLGDDALAPAVAYDSSLDASIRAEFSTAAYRLGHSMLSSRLRRIGADGNTIPQGDLFLAQGFFRPDKLMTDGGVDPLLRGLAAGQMQEIDTQLIDDVRNMLFGLPGAGGMDLAAINIQRGRDLGLADLNGVRVAYGLAPIATFEELNPRIASLLGAIYGGDIGAIDPWVGMLAEPHVEGGSVGETIRAVLIDQFARLREGDRYWYQWDPDLSQDDVAMIESSTLSNVIRRNTDIASLQSNVFFVSNCPCEMDGTPDGVNVLDLLVYLDLWLSQTGGDAPEGPGTGADFSGDGAVTVIDLLEFIDCWLTAQTGTCD